MSRSERWSNANEIRRTFHDIEDPAVGAGPILCTVKGRKYTDDGQSHIAVIGRTGLSGSAKAFIRTADTSAVRV